MKADNSKKDWLENPTGKIKKGSLCSCCARYNSRDLTGHALAIKEDKVLLVLRGIEPMKGYWALPAGYLDWDETIEECALRELKEETGLDGEISQLVGIYSDSKRDEDGRQNVGITYLVEVSGKVEVKEEVEEIQWFSLDNLPDKIAFDHRKMIEDAQRMFNI